jgi:tetratricopeptide (TPR) repeat protein
MKLLRSQFPGRRTLALCGFLLLAASGCQQSSDVDRAEYDYDDDVQTEPVRKKTAKRSDVRPKAEPRHNSVTSKKPRQAVEFATKQEEVEPPLSESIATPLPGRIISTAEAEQASLPAAYVGRPASAAVPQAAVVAAPTIDSSAALRQVDERNRNGAASFAKGAWFTARVEFGDALNRLAAALDAREKSSHRTTALAAGLTALNEAEAFTGRGPALANASTVLASHKTAPFVGPFAADVAPAVLHDAYLKFAVERLTESVAGSDAGSVALHGLGKVHNSAGTAIVDGRSKAHAFYAAALAVGPGNFLAANDLAVLLADEGRLEQARDLLHDGLRRSPQPAMWNNLAVVNDRLGRPDLAQLARQESAMLERRGAAAPGSVLPTHNVAWLDPRSFAATSRTGAEVAAPPPTAATAARPNAAPVAPPAGKPKAATAARPLNRALAY